MPRSALICTLASQVGGQNCTVLRQDGATGAISTVVLRASTDNLLDDLERAVDDGVNAYKVCNFPACRLRCPETICAMRRHVVEFRLQLPEHRHVHALFQGQGHTAKHCH